MNIPQNLRENTKRTASDTEAVLKTREEIRPYMNLCLDIGGDLYAKVTRLRGDRCRITFTAKPPCFSSWFISTRLRSEEKPYVWAYYPGGVLLQHNDICNWANLLRNAKQSPVLSAGQLLQRYDYFYVNHIMYSYRNYRVPVLIRHPVSLLHVFDCSLRELP